MDTNKEIRALITGKASGKDIRVEQLLNNSPVIVATLSKLNNVERNVRHDSDGNRTIVTPNRSGLSDISADIAQISNDNENTLQLFPELEQALRILINAVLSPKDQNSSEITYSIPNDLKVSALSGKLMPIIDKVLSKDLKLKEMLSDLLYTTLGVDGCYPMVVIPESAVDDMINDRKTISTESLIEHYGNGTTIIKSLGLLGDSDFNKQVNKDKSLSFESFVNNASVGRGSITNPNIEFQVSSKNIDTLIRVTDNIDILKFPDLVNIKRDEEINRRLDENFRSSIFSSRGIDMVALESNINNPTGVYGSSELNDIQLTQLLYKNNPNIRNVTRKIKSSDDTIRYNVGAPLLKKFPAESVIPACMSGDKKKHIAYFILLDGIGNPLSKDNANAVYDDFRRNQQGFKTGNQSLASSLIQRTADAMNTSCNDVTYQQMQKVCHEIIETDLLSRMRNGIYGDDIALVDNTLVYDIMMSRMFKDQQTQVLFVPAKLMTYFAYKYRKNGTGKTLLEDSQVLNAMRAVMMFANINRSVVNSIGRTNVKIALDENDPSKSKTIDIIKHEVLKGRQSQALPATISPTDITSYLKTSQVYFTFDQVRGLPGTSVDFSETQSDYTKPDTELMSQLDKKAIMGLGVPPELVSETEGIEFATNIVANNIRLNKQVVQIQDAFQPQMSNLTRVYCMNHGDVVKEVEEVIRKNIGELTNIKEPDDLISSLASNEEVLVRLLAREFLSNINANFARPDTVTLKNQMEAFTEYEEAVDKTLKYHLSDDILSAATSGEITQEQVGLLFNTIKAYYIREWLKKNTIMPELFDVLQNSDDENKTQINVFDISSKYANSITVSIGEFLKRVLPVASALNRDLEAATQGDDLEAGPGSSSSGGSSSSDSSTDDGSDESADDDTEGDSGDDGSSDLPAMPDLDSF